MRAPNSGPLRLFGEIDHGRSAHTPKDDNQPERFNGSRARLSH